MQGRNRSPKHDPAASNNASSAIHSPQQWFRPSLNRSVPNLAKAQHQNRSLGFSSIRDLARTTRRPLATLPANVSQPPNHTVRPSNSLYGTLRDQCSPPPPPVPEPVVPSAIALRRSQSSSANSFTPEQSGTSIGSSDPTTPSPAKHSAFYELHTSPVLATKDMGNKGSSIIKKPLPIKGKSSVARLDDEQEKSSDSSIREPDKKQPATFSPRGSSLAVKVPRRRSSLTVLHLDTSNFNTPDPKQPNLEQRASTFTEPLERQPSTLAETIRPVLSNVSTLTPLNVVPNRETALSPPILSPTSRISSTSSQSPSMAPPSGNPRSSVLGSRIHLPKTFPHGPVPIPVPPLTRTHHQCYTHHKRVLASKNTNCPVPCMACAANADDMWRCTFCMLRICSTCMAVFDARKRNLEGLLDWLAKGKDRDEEGMKEVVADKREEKDKKDGDTVKGKEDLEKAMEEQALKKAETTRKRETR